MHNKVGICITTHNDEKHIGDNLLTVLKQKTSIEYDIYVVDDGSKDKTPQILKALAEKHKNIHLFLTPNRERGEARNLAIGEAIKDKCKFICFFDSDMKLQENLIDTCISKIQSKSLSALVIPEKPFSNHSNYMSKVKVFERTLINEVGEKIEKNSIEGARFWRTSEYIRSGGLNRSQIAFEDTQPTIRILEKGGTIERAVGTRIYHDEGRVTLKALLKKKYYYFKQMPKTFQTEEGGFFKALQRWYFFRPYLYSKSNILLYLKNPLKFFGLILMYLCLTVIAVYAKQKS